MKDEPKVYIALEGEDGELIVNGPLCLLERLAAALGGGREAAPVCLTTRDEDSSQHLGARHPMLERLASESE